jgi:hypothetical protein
LQSSCQAYGGTAGRVAELREVARKAVSVICGCRVEAGSAATHSDVSSKRK